MDNGLVDILNTQGLKSFEFFADDGNVNTFTNNSLNSIQTNSLLSKTFFSKENFDQLQNMIRYNVYIQSGKKYIIGKQDNTQLQIIMRSIYLQNSKNLDTNIQKQIRELNSLVLDYSVPNIIVGVQQYMGYKKDVSTISEPIPLAQSTDKNKNKELNLTDKLFI